jgi:hypothetical protein
MERSLTFDFSMPLMSLPRKIVTRRPQEDLDGSAYLSVFADQFWMALIFTAFILAVMLYYILKLEPKTDTQQCHSFLDTACFTVLSLCCHEIVAMKANCSGRILILMILFWGFLISCSYNAILTSSLAVSNVSPPIKSLRDLLESQEYTLILENGTVTTDYFRLAPENSTGIIEQTIFSNLQINLKGNCGRLSSFSFWFENQFWWLGEKLDSSNAHG